MKVNLKTKLGYGIGDLASNLLFQLTVIYLMFFYTDVFKIPALVAGIIFLVARIWDAINDPIMGLIIDRTKSKHGKARVYILYGSLPLALFTVLMFYTPDVSTSMKIAYASIIYVIWGMLYTLVNVSYSSLTATLTNNMQERTSLSSVRMIFMLIGVIIISVATEPIVSSFTLNTNGYLFVAILYSTCAFILFLLCFKLTAIAKDREVETEKYALREVGSIILKNKQLLIISIVSLIGNSAVFMRETAAIYYVKYNLGNEGLLPLFLGIVVLFMVLSNVFIPRIASKFGKKKTYLIGSIIGIIGSIIFYFIPYDNLFLIFLFAGISSFGMAMISTLGWAMVPDTIEYGEWKLGIRTEGITYAVFSFSQKFATALAGFFVATILHVTSYVENATSQSSLALQGILSTLTIVPIILIIISMLIISRYKISTTVYQEIMDQLALRKGESNEKNIS